MQSVIIPEHSFPYVKVVINDNSEVIDEGLNNVVVNPTVNYFFPIASSQGIDNKIIRVNTQKEAKRIFGPANFAKYGQPYTQALNVLNNNNAVVYFLRVMPEDATYAHNAISIGYKADIDRKKFSIKLVNNYSDPLQDRSAISIRTPSDLANFAVSSAVIPDIESEWADSKLFWNANLNYFSTKLTNLRKKINSLYVSEEEYPLDTKAYLESGDVAYDYDAFYTGKASYVEHTDENPTNAYSVVMSVTMVETENGSEPIVRPTVVKRNATIIVDSIIDATSEAAVAASIAEHVSVDTENGSFSVDGVAQTMNVADAYFVFKLTDDNGNIYRAVYRYVQVVDDSDPENPVDVWKFVLAEPMKMFMMSYNEIQATVEDGTFVQPAGEPDYTVVWDGSTSEKVLILVDVVTGNAYCPRYAMIAAPTERNTVDEVATDTETVPEINENQQLFMEAWYEYLIISGVKTNIRKITEPIDKAGYHVVPFMTLRSSGRGSYGNSYAIVADPEPIYEKKLGVKLYTFTVGTVDNGFTAAAWYTASPVSTAKVKSTSTYINDVMDDIDPGIAPVVMSVDEDALDELYDAYVEFVNEVIDTYSDSDVVAAEQKASDLWDAYQKLYIPFISAYPVLSESEVVNFEADCRVPAWVTDVEKFFNNPNWDKGTDDDGDGVYEPDGSYNPNKGDTLPGVQQIRVAYQNYMNAYLEYKRLKNEYDAVTKNELPAKDEFDWIFGRMMEDVGDLPYVEIIKDPTLDGEDLADFKNASGVPLKCGTNGYFDNPRTVTKTVYTSDGIKELKTVNWTFADEVEDLYKKAWNGTLDPIILSDRRTPIDAFFDANYPMSSKVEMAKLAIARESSMCYLDCGIQPAITSALVGKLEEEFAGFDHRTLSKNLGSYTIKDPETNKRIKVTITYLMAARFAYHVINLGKQIPMTQTWCELTGHVKNSLVPAIEDYMTEIKDSLVAARINFFETIADNTYRRCMQYTAQNMLSDLSEESNMLVLYQLKREVTQILTDSFYDFADASVQTLLARKIATKYENWNNNIVRSVNVIFTQSAYEQNHSIIHCNLVVVFRPLIEQAILEIDINRRETADIYIGSLESTGTGEE